MRFAPAFHDLYRKAALATAITLCAGVAQARDDRPNILLVVSDDLGFTDVGPFGGEIHTPNLDRLAELGVRFTDFHASVSCSPTRSMLLTGTDNHLAGLGNMGELLSENQKGRPGYEGHLNDRVVTLQEVLRDAGYDTYMAGKWHLGHEEGLYPSDRGFDRVLSLLNGGGSHYADMSGLMEADHPVKYVEDGVLLDELPTGFYSSRSYADFLIDAIRDGRDGGRPFLAYLAFTSPHDPMHVPKPWSEHYLGDYDEGYEALHEKRVARVIEMGLFPEGTPVPEVGDIVRRWDDLSLSEKAREARAMEIYAGMVTNMDYNLGRVITYLEDIGELDDTIVVFMSDNGPNPYYSNDYPGNDEGLFLQTFDDGIEAMGTRESAYAYGPGWASAGAGPLNAFKMTSAEGGIRVPLIIHWPGGRRNEVTAEFAYVWDIMPTLLDGIGIEHPEEFNGSPVERTRGISMVPFLSGETDQVYDDEAFVGGELSNGKWMRQGAYKIRLIPPPYGEGEWELFNVEEDPGETTELGPEFPDIRDRLTAAYDAYAEEVGVIPMER